MTLAKAVSDVFARHGATWTLRRASRAAGANDWTAGAETVTYSTFAARERGYKPGEIRGGIQEKDALVIVDAASASVAPAEGDRVALGSFTADAGAEWRHVVNVYAVRRAATTLVYRLQVRR